MALQADTLFYPLITVILIVIVIYLRRDYRRSRTEQLNLQRVRIEAIRERRRLAAQQVASRNQERVLSDGEKEARREHILMRVDVKKIVSNETKDITSDQITLKAIQALSNKHQTDKNETNIVQELLRNVSGTLTSTDVTHEDEEEAHKSSTIPNEKTANDEQEIEAVCPICLDVYKVGDDVCFSRNVECPHEFHLDCMLDWLMMVSSEERECRDDCPLCRVDYLKVSKDESV